MAGSAHPSIFGPATEGVPRVFLSYSWDSDEHEAWVKDLTICLRRDGIEVLSDQFHLHPGMEKQYFMEQAVAQSEFVIVVCTDNYAKRANNREGGVGYESLIVTSEMAEHIHTRKFIPVLRLGSFATALPLYLKGRIGVDLRGTPYRTTEYEKLIRVLHGEMIQPPPIGKKPDFSLAPTALSAPTVSAATPPPPSLICDRSPRAELISTELSMRAFPVVYRCSWSDAIELSVLADTSEVDAIFTRLRDHTKPVVVAVGFDVAVATLETLDRTMEGSVAMWKARFAPSRTSFSNDMEMGTSGTTADEFAELRARRLLLNESPKAFQSSENDFIGLANEAMRENLLQGLNSIVKIERSSFFDLYVDFGHDPQLFLQIAWIATIADLKLSAAVEQIHHLRLALDGDQLAVDFAGRRHRKYVNVPPHEIRVNGGLRLATGDPVTPAAAVPDTPSVAASSQESANRHREARRILAPELQRTIERVLFIHGRALANFLAHSTNSSQKPNDVKQDFLPHWPNLYPSAPAVRELAEDDSAALTAYYDSLHALNDEVNDWWARDGQLPINLFNVFRDKASRSLRLALLCVERLDLENLIPPPYESWGTISSRIRDALRSDEKIMQAHLQRAAAKTAK